MKLTLAIFLICLIQVSASVYSQSSKLTFDFQEKKVSDVLMEIEKSTGYRFFYQREQVDVDRKVNLQAVNKSVEEILAVLFQGQNISFKIMEDKLILLNTANNVSRQARSVSGKVTDSSGQPLPGVSVVLKGTTTGTITDFDGKYTLANVPDNAILVFSFVGMKGQEILVTGKSTINLVMEEDAIGIEEVVAIGYGVAKKSDLTGAITQVKADVMKNYAPSNVSDLLRTSIPGLSAGYSTTAKGNSSMLIRGETTLTAGSSPLIVLDGVIYNGDLSDINPDDIDRMDVMKDASSAAVYGSRATNGVIAITTKKGSGGKSVINVSSTVGIATAANRMKPYNAEGFINWRSDMFKSVFSATVPREPWSPFDDPRTIDQQYLSQWLTYHSTNEANMVDAWLPDYD